MKTLLLTMSEVRGLLDLDKIYEAVADGYRAFNKGLVKQPPFLDLHRPGGDGGLDIKAGTNEDSGIMSVKFSSGGFTFNPEKDLPKNIDVVNLLDADTSRPLCIMDGSQITGCRTAAAGAISVDLLARKNAHTLLMIGSGNIARRELRAIVRVRDITQVYVWNHNYDHAKEYASEMQDELGIKIEAMEDLKTACSKADIIVTATRAKTGPMLRKEFIRPGTHIVATGTDGPTKQELFADCLGGVKLVCDSIHFCKDRGETYHALQEGIITLDDIYGEIGEILLNKKPGRENDEEITIFDTVGMPIQDISMATAIYKLALEKGIGTWFDFLE